MRPKTQDGPSQRTDVSVPSGQEQYKRTNAPRRVFILGVGAVGKLVAHSLRGIPNAPPITLLFHNADTMRLWERSPKKITLVNKQGRESREGFEAELMPPFQQDIKNPDDPMGVEDENWRQFRERTPQMDEATAEGMKYSPEKANSPIHNLIVTVKANHTVKALAGLRHRLLPSSTICFLQNGMGIVEEVNKYIFPDPETRPTYMLGIISHGVNTPASSVRNTSFTQHRENNTFVVNHAGLGTIALGIFPREPLSAASPLSTHSPDTTHPSTTAKPIWNPSARYLLRTLTRTPPLCAVAMSPTELHQQQLEKLAINSIINPLTALLDAPNASILYNTSLSRVMRLLLAETCYVIQSLPELRGLPNLATRFSPARIETLVVSIAAKTQHNISSMLQDIRKGKATTEIDFINGYIIRRGEEMGLQCGANFLMVHLVRGKVLEGRKRNEGFVPLGGEVPRGRDMFKPDQQGLEGSLGEMFGLGSGGGRAEGVEVEGKRMELNPGNGGLGDEDTATAPMDVQKDAITASPEVRKEAPPLDGAEEPKKLPDKPWGSQIQRPRGSSKRS